MAFALFAYAFLAAIVVVAVAVGGLTSIIAFYRQHPSRWIILLVNVVLGGTGIGWLFALLWALGLVHLPWDDRGTERPPRPASPVTRGPN